MFLVGFVLAIAVSGYLIYDLNAQRATTARLRQDVERKEREAQTAQLPGVEEQNKWADQERRVNEILLPAETVPLFFEEVTRLANENGLERLDINSDEMVLDPGKSTSADEAVPASIGIRRYIVITLKFQGDYQNVAGFLGGISKLERPLEYRMVEMRRNPPKVEVTIVMNVYKREAA
jgi:Tfp pilus assembly protein PilO